MKNDAYHFENNHCVQKLWEKKDHCQVVMKIDYALIDFIIDLLKN